MISRTAFLLLSLLAALAASAAGTDSVTTVRPVVSAYTLGFGSAHLCDTYLTPLKYSGWGAHLSYERMQAMRFDPERWVMQLTGTLAVERTQNPARNMTMWDLDIDLRWAMMRRFAVDEHFRVAIGGATGVTAGALYNRRNGNNPVSAKAAWTVDATAMATYSVRISRLPVTFRYQAVMPLTGMFFSPDYGELYYEIYLGNHRGLVHAAWPGNYFKLTNLITADLHLGATSLRLGYSNCVFSSKANEIVSRRTTHLFVIGVSTEWLSLHPAHRPDPTVRIISAIY